MRPWWLLILLIPGVPAQGGVLEVTLEAYEFGVAPETWKAGTPSEETFRDDFSGWSASLGHYLDVNLDVRRAGATTPTTWQYEVTLSDGANALLGQTTAVGSGKLAVRFDVDGQRAVYDQPASEPLLAGTWTIQVVATTENGLASRPEGTGRVSLATQPLRFEQLASSDGVEPGIAVPEEILPHMRELGPGPNTWMPLRAQSGGVMATVLTTPGHEVTWQIWQAVVGVDEVPAGFPVVARPDPFAGTPLAGTDSLADRTRWFSSEPTTTHAGHDGAAVLGFLMPATPALAVVTAHGLEGGMAAFVITSGHTYQVSTMQASEPGAEGPVSMEAIGQLGLPAPLYVLQQGTPSTTGDQLGGALITTGTLAPTGEDVWAGGYDGLATREAAVPYVALLAFFQDATGAYLGHLAGVRGLSADIDASLLGVGQDGAIAMVLDHAQQGAPLDPGLSVGAQLDLKFLDQTFVDTVELAAGGQLTRSFGIQPSTPGNHIATATIDTGDLRFEVARNIEVLAADAYEDATAPWYQIPGPSVLLALLAAALVVRKREI